MKTKLVVLIAAVVGFSFAAISGTDHDFSGQSWTDEVCNVCHTPHNAMMDGGSAVTPLWNHALSTATYTVYNSGSLDASLSNPPDGSSKLCLSCHDGTVAVDNFGGTDAGVYGSLTGDKNLGNDLSNDHPISFTFDDALATTDGGLHAPSTTSALGGTIETTMLEVGKMQCTSCHDPHDATNGNFLLMANTNSDLCLTCHNK